MWVLRPQVMMEKCSLKQKNQKRCWPRKCRRGQCLCNTMYVIPLVCVGFYLKSGGNIGRCFWPTGSQNHIRKSCRIFPMETETPWKFVIQGFGILWKSYGPIHTHRGASLARHFLGPGDSGKRPCASCTTARTPRLRCDRRCISLTSIDMPKRGWTFNVLFTCFSCLFNFHRLESVHPPGRQAAEAHLLAKDVVLQAQQRGRQVDPLWTIIES